MSDLETIGYSDWFRSRADAEAAAAHAVARVVSVHRDSYTVTRGGADVFAELSGNLLYSAESAIDLPTTGDWVYADFYDDETHAIIHGVFPRRTLLKRKTSGKLVALQLIAANVDVAFIIQSLNENFNPRRLERYLAMVNEGGIVPVVLLSKCDLMPGERAREIAREVAGIAPHTTVMEFSNQTGMNVASIISSLQSGASYCLLGSSGVGKTTLLNTIIGAERFETRPVSRIQSKGRHTTTTRQLVRLASGAMIIDTPGMRELGSMAMEDGLDETFNEIAELSHDCRFTDCSHTGDKGCAVVAAVKAGDLPEPRYQNYLKMKKESDFNQMSYLEKKRKDKSFGKLVKSVKKTMLR